MGLTKQQKHKISLIQKEQQQLSKIQQELCNVFTKVNEAINVLKVEELQLKSSAMVFDSPRNLDICQMNKQSEESTKIDLKPSVSQQSNNGIQQSAILDLNVIKRQDLEEYEEEEVELNA